MRREQHHRDDVVDELRVLDHDHRAGLDAMDQHRGHQHGGGRRARHRERQHRNDARPGTQALSPVSAAIRPSIEPLPNFSFSLLARFAAA